MNRDRIADAAAQTVYEKDYPPFLGRMSWDLEHGSVKESYLEVGRDVVTALEPLFRALFAEAEPGQDPGVPSGAVGV